MIELILISLTSLWSADNHAFLEKASTTNWEYVGYTARQSGPQPDGAYALTANVDGKSYILFKQRPSRQQVAYRHLSE